MTLDECQVLEALVSLDDESDTSISVARLATRLDSDPEETEAALAALCEYELTEAMEGGYRPTVTGREFLALDVDDEEFVIVETTGESEENPSRS